METRIISLVLYLGIVYKVNPPVAQWARLMYYCCVFVTIVLIIVSDLQWFHYALHLITLILIMWEKAAEKKLPAPTPPANAAPVEKPSARRVSRPIARLSAKHVEVVA